MTLVAFAGCVAMSVELVSGRRFRLPQRDRETPQRWLDLGPVRWAVLNGAALGVGAGTRIGMWLWFGMPLLIAWSGNIAFGAIVFGVYGALRTGLAAVGLRLSMHYPVADVILSQTSRARLLSRAAFLSVCLALFLDAGFSSGH